MSGFGSYKKTKYQLKTAEQVLRLTTRKQIFLTTKLLFILLAQTFYSQLKAVIDLNFYFHVT